MRQPAVVAATRERDADGGQRRREPSPKFLKRRMAVHGKDNADVEIVVRRYLHD